MNKVVVAEAFLPEGPVWFVGALYYAEYGADRVSVWNGREGRPFWQRPGSGPSAIVPYANGFAVMAFDAGEIVLLSRHGEVTRTFANDRDGHRLTGPNDAVADARGGLYATASGPWRDTSIVGTVHYLDADGQLRLVADDLHFANGIALSPDGARLYVAESEAARIVSFAVAADGSLADRRLFARMTALGEPHDAYPDGIKLGPDGNLYVGFYNAGRIVVVDPAGRLVRRIDLPAPSAPNLAFSADGATLYVTVVDQPDAAPYRGRIITVDNR